MLSYIKRHYSAELPDYSYCLGSLSTRQTTACSSTYVMLRQGRVSAYLASLTVIEDGNPLMGLRSQLCATSLIGLDWFKVRVLAPYVYVSQLRHSM